MPSVTKPGAPPDTESGEATANQGAAAPAVEAALQGTGVVLERHATLEAAVRWSFARAEQGDAVLLSPACASFDMFTGYRQRGEAFAFEGKAWVVRSKTAASKSSSSSTSTAFPRLYGGWGAEC